MTGGSAFLERQETEQGNHHNFRQFPFVPSLIGCVVLVAMTKLTLLLDLCVILMLVCFLILLKVWVFS